MKKIYLVFVFLISFSSSCFGYERLYANDGTYLGTNNPNQYDSQSVFNQYGKYGSQYSSNSINNPYSQYGSQYSNNSVNNQYAQNGYAVDVNTGQQKRYGANQYSY